MKASSRIKLQSSAQSDDIEATVLLPASCTDRKPEPTDTDPIDADIELDGLDDDDDDIDLNDVMEDLLDDDGLEDDDEMLPEERGMSRTWWKERDSSPDSPPSLW